MRVLTWIVTLPLAMLVISFAISNRQELLLSIWPLPYAVLVPASLAILVALIIGFAAGGLTVWLRVTFKRRAQASAAVTDVPVTVPPVTNDEIRTLPVP